MAEYGELTPWAKAPEAATLVRNAAKTPTNANSFIVEVLIGNVME